MELGHDMDMVESTKTYVGDPLTNLMVTIKKQMAQYIMFR
jgi:hypothetical protein